MLLYVGSLITDSGLHLSSMTTSPYHTVNFILIHALMDPEIVVTYRYLKSSLQSYIQVTAT